MKKMFSILLLALTSVSAFASDPCEPTVHAQPSYLNCNEGRTNYWIVIDTMMSDIRKCPLDQFIEVNTAKVKISTLGSSSKKTLELEAGTFEYKTGLPGMDEGYFKNEENGLDLTGCATPAHGGLSAGN